ncbi:alpha/beta fold hydrolase [Streptomyces sp. HF10]|uniref:alpha/beta fold hydrolase n=1 Tax=Streptomyces sp. HF10 TaxID=2692233 RepID=UPI00131647CD|nr:alpha/beta fold hydrolase [Streptomyces sp. HF10]QHC27516.1 delta-12-desaturase [Streptomyces sp. HF10]QHC33130.1 delta-12-desaturase [Streptomyces sp. HF10]
MTPHPLRRHAHTALSALAPRAAARWATDIFSSTRTYGPPPDDVLPLGAAHFTVHNNPDVTNGFTWNQNGTNGTALLVHGWAADSSSMHSLVPPLRDLGLRVAAFDGPAHGARKGNQATMTQYTRAVRAVLDTLDDVRVVIAHSLGSIAAITAIAQHTHPTPRCAVLIAPPATLGDVLQRWDGAGLHLTPPLIKAIHTELHHRNGVPVSHWDLAARGATLDLPTLILHDPHDPMVPHTDAQKITAGLKNARLINQTGGHTAILTNPDTTTHITHFTTQHLTTPHPHPHPHPHPQPQPQREGTT